MGSNGDFDMDIDVARYTVRQAFRTARELQDVMSFLKERCDPAEYKDYALDIAKAIDAVTVALLNRAVKAYPELEKEIEAKIGAYGRYL